MTIEEAFHEAMLGVYERVGRDLGYWAGYFLRSVRKHGGVGAARRILEHSGQAGKAKGFLVLTDAGRMDLSVEAVVLEPRFRALFTDGELAIARARLDGLWDLVVRTPVPAESIFPEVMPEDRSYIEGAVRRVVVNWYERDPHARDACIAKHGSRCAVCDLSFVERYGGIGAGFIHVHHKKPLATRRRA